MTMRWFGESWGAPMNDDCPQVDVPFGAQCIHCLELIDEDDRGVVYANGPVAHVECHFRSFAGGVNHQLGKCCCCGGTEPPDPPGMTSREAARAAMETWARLHHG